MAVINNFTTKTGLKRLLEVDIDEQDVHIEFTLSKGEDSTYELVCINKREALSLVYYLIKQLLPHKLLVNNKNFKQQ